MECLRLFTTHSSLPVHHHWRVTLTASCLWRNVSLFLSPAPVCYPLCYTYQLSAFTRFQFCFYHAMRHSAKHGLEIACHLSVCLPIRLSVCNVGGSGSHRLEILETNCTDTWPNIFALRCPKAIHLLPGEHGEILVRVEVGWERWHKQQYLWNV